MAKSGTEDVLKKDPAAEKAPDAGAVDSDKAKPMFATHALSPSAVLWSNLRTRSDVGGRTRAASPPTLDSGASLLDSSGGFGESATVRGAASGAGVSTTRP